MPLIRPLEKPVWASAAGDNVTPTDVELAAGWPVTSIPPARQRFNWFFNYVSNGIRYLTRRGVPDWSATEPYEIGDIQRSLVDGKTYRAILVNTGFEPSANPLKWERWGFSLAELFAILRSTHGGNCPVTGPAPSGVALGPPTTAAPWINYTSVTPYFENWQWNGLEWKVVSNRYGLTWSNNNQPLTASVSLTMLTLTVPRAGFMTLMGSIFNIASSAGHQMTCYITVNGQPIGASSVVGDITGRQLYQTAAMEIPVYVGDVLLIVMTSSVTFNASARASIQYKN